MSPVMTPERLAALLKALEASNYNAAPTDLVQGTGYYPLGDGDPRMKTDSAGECRCDIKDLMSTGHSPDCPERIVRKLQK